MASSIPFTGSDACDTAHAAGRPYCAGTLPTEQDPDGTPQYTMQHEYVFSSSGVGDFSPRFSYHEVHFLVITGLTETPTTAQITGYRVGNIAHLFEEDEEDGNAAAATATAAATGVAREQGSDAGRGSGDGGGRARLSHFSCSDSTLNAIYNTSLWTKANLVTGGMSVDCPHRERLGAKKHAFFEHFILNNDDLVQTGQARDKHRETWRKGGVFLQATSATRIHLSRPRCRTSIPYLSTQSGRLISVIFKATPLTQAAATDSASCHKASGTRKVQHPPLSPRASL